MEMKSAILILHYHGLMVRKLYQIPHLLDLLMRSWHEELFFRHEALLSRARVTYQHSVLFINLNSFLLATVQDSLTGPKEHLALTASSHDTHLAAGLIFNFHVLIHLQVYGTELVSVQNLLISSWKDCLLSSVNCDFTRDAVQQTNVLEGFQGPCFPHLAFLSPRRFQENQIFSLLDPPLTICSVLQPDILILLQHYGFPWMSAESFVKWI
mmetsp:Transcript_38959/g.70322  ORF Transcript_38959/g.70322 Transcript_38959/m.70322 type:complete len:211 (-) Transcript_38959:552-1184(-)